MSAYSDASPFLECQAILAAQEEDIAELHLIADQMLSGEKLRLRRAAHYLYDHLR